VIRHDEKRKLDHRGYNVSYYTAVCEVCDKEIASSEWEGEPDGLQYRLSVLEHLMIHIAENTARGHSIVG